MMDCVELSCELPVELEELLPEILGPLSVLGAQLGEAAGEVVPLRVFLHGDRAGEPARVRAALEAAGARRMAVRVVEGRDWLAGYREAARPFAAGRGWWIDPRPEAPTAPPIGRRRLAIEPRTAFGSGSHESTGLVLAALEDLSVRARSVLDVGTGSGILAIAAHRLGARPVVGFDLDRDATWVARRTAVEQDWPAELLLFTGPITAIGSFRFDIVLCNMIAEQQRPLLPELYRLLGPGGVVVLSGLLVAELGSMSSDLRRAGMAVRDERRSGEWLSLTAVRCDS
jgi:ribosomal protein L11 methyltransferase